LVGTLTPSEVSAVTGENEITKKKREQNRKSKHRARIFAISTTVLFSVKNLVGLSLLRPCRTKRDLQAAPLQIQVEFHAEGGIRQVARKKGDFWPKLEKTPIIESPGWIAVAPPWLIVNGRNVTITGAWAYRAVLGTRAR
jgi:hypothetical protein